MNSSAAPPSTKESELERFDTVARFIASASWRKEQNGWFMAHCKAFDSTEEASNGEGESTHAQHELWTEWIDYCETTLEDVLYEFKGASIESLTAFVGAHFDELAASSSSVDEDSLVSPRTLSLALFSRIDADGDGAIDITELLSFAAEINMIDDAAQLRALFPSGSINFEEFARLTTPLSAATFEEECAALASGLRLCDDFAAFAHECVRTNTRRCKLKGLRSLKSIAQTMTTQVQEQKKDSRQQHARIARRISMASLSLHKMLEAGLEMETQLDLQRHTKAMSPLARSRLASPVAASPPPSPVRSLPTSAMASPRSSELKKPGQLDSAPVNIPTHSSPRSPPLSPPRSPPRAASSSPRVATDSLLTKELGEALKASIAGPLPEARACLVPSPVANQLVTLSTTTAIADVTPWGTT